MADLPRTGRGYYDVAAWPGWGLPAAVHDDLWWAVMRLEMARDGPIPEAEMRLV